MKPITRDTEGMPRSGRSTRPPAVGCALAAQQGVTSTPRTAIGDQIRPARRPTTTARVLAFWCGLLAANAGAQTNLFTSEASVHDPAIVRTGSTFHVFGSHLAAASTVDLMNWTQISTSPAVGNPLVPNAAGEFQEVLTWAQTNTFWAPDVIRLQDGRYYMYYCACRGDAPRSALGLAVSDAIDGPYTHVAVLLKSGMSGTSEDGTTYDATRHPNVVDPAVFFDQAGKLWMVYGSYSGGIFIMEMDPATGRQKPGQGYGKKLIGGNHARIEGAHVLYSPPSNYYYLFLSFGGLGAADGYNIRVARSRNPDGPFLDSAGTDLTNVAGAPGTLFDDASIAPHGVKLMGSYQFLHVAGEPQMTSRGYNSPGHSSAYYDPATGKYFLVFHTRFVGRGEQHEVRVHQMFLNEDDWPVVAPHRYAQETIAPSQVSELAGDYKLINHGKAISGIVNPSVSISLRQDLAIGGSVTGTWSVSDGNDATLTISGVVYRGVFVRQWDDDNKTWVFAFSALSSNGVAIWGSKVATQPVNAAPTITVQPISQTVSVGSPAKFSVTANGTPEPTFQWRKGTTDIAGATGRELTLANVTAADAGSYTVAVTNAVGTVTSAAAVLTVAARPEQVTIPNGDSTAKIVNLSTRGIVAQGENVLIAGFVIAGQSPKKLLILASGLNLSRRFGLTGVIGRPKFTLNHTVNGTNHVLAENNNWQANQMEISELGTQLGATPLSESADPANGDAGLIVTLSPGVYSVVVAPDALSATQDGIGLIEIYDAMPSGDSQLVNISSRGKIETGARQMFVGVVVNGSGRARLMIRGVGAALKDMGVSQFLPDPSQTVYRHANGAQTAVSTNNDWWNSAQADQTAELAAKLGAFPLGASSTDSAVLRLTEPGVYSAIIAPSGGTTGVALAEIYLANEQP